MRYSADRMTLADLPRIMEIERLAYPSPWPSSAYRKELQENRHAHYIVVRDTAIVVPAEPEKHEPVTRRPFPLSLLPGRSAPLSRGELASIVGFAGLWLMFDEAHVTTIAMHPDFRGLGLGELLLNTLIGIAYDIQASHVTLEVRVSNAVAQNLYRKYGFMLAGTRHRYYSDNQEDAFIMTTSPISSPGYREQYTRLRTALRARLEAAESASSPASEQTSLRGDG